MATNPFPTVPVSEAAAAAVADAVRAERLARQNDGLNPDSRVREAGGYSAMLALREQLLREQQQTANRVVGMAGSLSPAAAAVVSVGKP